MGEVEGSRYWCHLCSQRVSPIMEVESVKCPICRSGFVEEMASAAATTNPGTIDDDPFAFGTPSSDRATSLWAPILMGMMNNPHRLPRFRRFRFEEDDEDDLNNERIHHHHHGRHRHHHELGMDLDNELDPALNVSRTRTTNVLQFLHGIRSAIQSGQENSENDQRGERRDGGRVILINPLNQTIVIQGSSDANGNSQNLPIGSLGDYFVGPGLELLLQHLSENDPNRHGTPPAKKEAVEALPDVKIEGTLQCSVCLEEFQNGGQAKEMPCKHKFHSACILPWLELHSSCPVCRYQLPWDESKPNSEWSLNNTSNSSNNEGDDSRREEGGGGEGGNENGGRFSLPLPWPFSSLFASSGSRSSEANSASTSSGPSTNVTSHAHDD